MSKPLFNDTDFSHYRILQKIGAGGMGEVFLAEDTRLNRKVAIKMLPLEVARDPERMRRFTQEAKAVSALNHPHILTIYEIDVSDSRHFIVTEFIEGTTLRHHMLSQRMKLDDVLEIAIQAADAVIAAHEAGIIHRDIKPENIMVRRRDGYIKVLDFGLAKITEPGLDAINSEAPTRTHIKTAPGVVGGTVLYMSPEQARGLVVDARTDIWSLGVVLYEMLAGQVPFNGANANEVVADILSDREPAPLARYSRDAPLELERIVTKALRKNREERYQTVKDLVLDLKSLKQRLVFEAELERVSPSDRRIATLAPNLAADTDDVRGAGEITGLLAKPNSVAVLPFANMSKDPENEYFCDGLAEELLYALAKIDDLKVAARTSAFSFKGKDCNVSEVGRALNVKTVLEGSVRKSGDRVRITVQLINVADGYHLWSERYDCEMHDIFDVQDKITLAVVDVLKVKLFAEEKAAVLKRYTGNAEAYQLFLKGRYYWFKGTPADAIKSRHFFQQAIDLDPAYALGYVGLGDYYGYSAALGWLPPYEGWPKEEAALAKALELDETLPEVHNGLAALRMFYYRDWTGTEKEVQRAVALNPNFAEIHNLYAFYLVALGRFEDAIEEVRRSLELDPLRVRNIRNLGYWHYYARRYDEAIKQYRDALELDPSNTIVYEDLGHAFERKGLQGEAVAAWGKAMTLAGDDELFSILDKSYASGSFSVALQAITKKRLERLNDRRRTGEYVPAIEFARVYTRLGDKDRALHWLEEAADERNMFALLINGDPLYDGLRTDPRFPKLLKKVSFS